jgi:undecaprenyl-diphosphatase
LYRIEHLQAGHDLARREDAHLELVVGQFSFFLAIPTMLGATVYDLYKNWKTLDWQGGGLIAIGFVVAFLSALVVVKPFLHFVSRHGFGVFAWYRIAVGALALVLLVMR